MRRTALRTVKVIVLRIMSLNEQPNCTAQLVKFPAFVRNPEVHYRFHKSLPLDPVQRQFNAFHTPRPVFFKILLQVTKLGQ